MQNDQAEGVRRRFLKCKAWVGTAATWTMTLGFGLKGRSGNGSLCNTQNPNSPSPTDGFAVPTNLVAINGSMSFSPNPDTGVRVRGHFNSQTIESAARHGVPHRQVD